MYISKNNHGGFSFLFEWPISLLTLSFSYSHFYAITWYLVIKNSVISNIVISISPLSQPDSPTQYFIHPISLLSTFFSSWLLLQCPTEFTLSTLINFSPYRYPICIHICILQLSFLIPPLIIQLHLLSTPWFMSHWRSRIISTTILPLFLHWTNNQNSFHITNIFPITRFFITINIGSLRIKHTNPIIVVCQWRKKRLLNLFQLIDRPALTISDRFYFSLLYFILFQLLSFVNLIYHFFLQCMDSLNERKRFQRHSINVQYIQKQKT